MIPIDNSVAGRVADIHHLTPDRVRTSYRIAAGAASPMAPKRATEDDPDGGSHVHALGQCRNIIRKLGIKAVVAADTAALPRGGGGGRHARAALATELAANCTG